MGTRAGAAAVLAVLVLPGCAAAAEDASGGVTVTGTGAALRLDCGGRDVQAGSVALPEGAGLPDPAAAVAEAQDTGWLPAGRADALEGAGRGVVRADGQVVAVFTLEDVGDGWYVTSVETCAEERRP